jgi:hypothetical protein
MLKSSPLQAVADDPEQTTQKLLGQPSESPTNAANALDRKRNSYDDEVVERKPSPVAAKRNSPSPVVSKRYSGNSPILAPLETPERRSFTEHAEPAPLRPQSTLLAIGITLEHHNRYS